MNPIPNEYMAVARHLLNACGTAIASHGWMKGEDWAVVAGLILAVLPILYEWRSARRARKLLLPHVDKNP